MLHKTVPVLSKNEICQPKKFKCPIPKEDECSSESKETPCMPKQNVGSESFIRMPYMLRIIGPKHISIVSAFIPSLIIYGLAALIAVVYITEFKTVLQFLPFYNTVYKEEEEPKSTEKSPPPPPSSDEDQVEGEGEGEPSPSTDSSESKKNEC